MNKLQQPCKERKLRLYAHMICKSTEDISKAFHAIDVVEKVASYLCSMYGGRKDNSDAELCVQYNDVVYITVSDACVKQIEKDFPFVSSVSYNPY